MTLDWIARDLKHNWHPCSQMKDYESFPPMLIKSAYQSYIELQNGHRLIDAISSWWCKSLGHKHPKLQAALKTQMEHFEHVIFANTTSEALIKFAEKVSTLSPGLDKVLYASDGSCAVEMALKMSLHSRLITGQTQRKTFMALENSYHGETLLALSVSDLGRFRDPYASILIPTPFLKGIPYVSGVHDPLWQDCSAYWPRIEAQLNEHKDSLTAIIVEPIVQGSAGMRVYSADFLKRLRAWTKQHDVHLVADEIMTGLYRTGRALAIDHAGIQPDFLCLAKGLTGGFLPLSVTLTTSNIYELFYDDYAKGKTFIHSHTHSGNVLAAAVGCAVFEAMAEEKISEKMSAFEQTLQRLFERVSTETQALEPIRGIGGIVAADLKNPQRHFRLGYQVYQEAVRLGALLRPLGNTVYWLPPLNADRQVLEALADITREAISNTLKNTPQKPQADAFEASTC